MKCWLLDWLEEVDEDSFMLSYLCENIKKKRVIESYIYVLSFILYGCIWKKNATKRDKFSIACMHEWYIMIIYCEERMWDF